MSEAFLDCNVWELCPLYEYTQEDTVFFLVLKVYHYNSLHSDIVNYTPSTIQVPQFEIQNLSLLDDLNYDLISRHKIPIISRYNDECFKVDFTIYNRVLEDLNNVKNTSV